MEEPDDRDAGREQAGGATPRAKVFTVVVVAIVMVATLLLCCMATGQLGELFQLRLPPP